MSNRLRELATGLAITAVVWLSVAAVSWVLLFAWERGNPGALGVDALVATGFLAGFGRVLGLEVLAWDSPRGIILSLLLIPVVMILLAAAGLLTMDFARALGVATLMATLGYSLLDHLYHRVSEGGEAGAS